VEVGVPAEQFGPYQLGERIGRGGMGEVFRAFDTVRGRVVALKRLPAELAADPDYRARFQSESTLTARLNEPHIIPIHDFGEIDGRLFIDMRLVEGNDLAAQLANHGPLSPVHAVNVITQVAAALDAAHRVGLVHRDIKPANLLLANGEAGEFVYVADFGIARVAASNGQVSLTATGATVGTLDYIAPERFVHGHGDHRVDIYALGCVLYESLTGSKPFSGDGLLAQMYAHVNTAPPRPSQQPGVPAGFDGIIARALAKEPQERYSSAGELAAAAQAALAATTPLPAAAPTAAGSAAPPGYGHGGSPTSIAPVRNAADPSVAVSSISRRRATVAIAFTTLIVAALLVVAGVLVRHTKVDDSSNQAAPRTTQAAPSTTQAAPSTTQVAPTVSRIDPIAPADTLAVGTLTDGRLQAWEISGENLRSRWKITTDPNSGWTSWSSFPQPGPLKSIAVGRLPDGRLQLFAMDTGGDRWSCWKKTMNPNAGWTTWSPF
jgi:serine/threonine-protein kinase